MTAASLARVSPVPALPPIVAETWADAPEVDALIDRAFGPGRFVKAAERLREHRKPIWTLSFIARDDGRLVGCVRQWAIRIGGAPSVLLGPFAVESLYRSRGLGAALIQRACEAAKAAGHGSILLVGDRPYFEPLGFEPVEAGRIRLPGPVDPRRVLVMPLADEARLLAGEVVAGWAD
jgi:predicted N-acetyltransferase YhbS